VRARAETAIAHHVNDEPMAIGDTFDFSLHGTGVGINEDLKHDALLEGAL